MKQHFFLMAIAAAAVVSGGSWAIGQRSEPPASAWPQWRGPNRDGQVGGKAWPKRLTRQTLQPLWRVPLSPSYSGPVVSDSLVFTTETRNKETEAVYGIDRRTGKQVWRAEWKGAITVPFFAASNGSWIRATPAYDGERLYVAGMRDLLVCLEAKTGRELWRLDFVQKLGAPLPDFGFVSSPLIDGDSVYVQAGASVIRLNKITGAVIWRTLEDKGGMLGGAFSSPIIATLSGRRQLVVQGREKLAGVDLTNGTVLWSRNVPAFRGMNILTPLQLGDSLFTSSYQNQAWLFKISAEQGAFTVSDVWAGKAQGYMSSPVLIGGHLYMHLQSNRFTCLDAKTGERKWTSEPVGKYCSLVAQGDRILALDQGGSLLLIRANPERYELVDSLRISDEETWAHLAVSANQLFVRELGALAAFKWEEGK